MVRGRQNGSAFASSPTPSPKALLIPSEAENPRCKQRGFFSRSMFCRRRQSSRVAITAPVGPVKGSDQIEFT
jgi:hypothetical protein